MEELAPCPWSNSPLKPCLPDQSRKPMNIRSLMTIDCNTISVDNETKIYIDALCHMWPTFFARLQVWVHDSPFFFQVLYLHLLLHKQFWWLCSHTLMSLFIKIDLVVAVVEVDSSTLIWWWMCGWLVNICMRSLKWSGAGYGRYTVTGTIELMWAEQLFDHLLFDNKSSTIDGLMPFLSQIMKACTLCPAFQISAA